MIVAGRIYTRRGHGGETGLIGGERVSKTHVRTRARGGVDESNAAIGLAVARVSRRGATSVPDAAAAGTR